MSDFPQPRVWIGCLASYNAGRLIGEWFDVPTDTGELQAHIDAVLEQARKVATEKGDLLYVNPEEWFFADREYLPGDLDYENPDMADLCHYAEVIEGLDSERAWACYLWLDYESGRDVDSWEDHYRGTRDSFTDYVREMVEEIGYSNVPAHIDMGYEYESRNGSRFLKPFEELSSIIDWDAIAQEEKQRFTVIEHEGTTYIFEDDV